MLNNLWNIIIRFDTPEHLYSWTQSDTRRVLVEEIAPLLAEGDKTEIRTEAAFWFTPPASMYASPNAGNSSDNPAGDISNAIWCRGSTGIVLPAT